jgi:small subunit ribosomal protein S3
MGHKTHPVGFRLGIVKDWQARWFAGNQATYRETLLEDLRLRKAIAQKYVDADVARVEIERNTQEVVLTIHTARPGMVIGRQGQKVDELKNALQALTRKNIRLNVQEIRQPEKDAFLVAQNIVSQLERRISYRRAMQQAATRSMQAGVDGIKILISGRLNGAEIARKDKVMMGRVPLHTIIADMDFASTEAKTAMGKIGVKVWIYKGNILKEVKEEESEEIAMIHVTVNDEKDADQTDAGEEEVVTSVTTKED